MRVTLRKSVKVMDSSLGRVNDWAEEEVAWPRGWPLPDAGTIVLGREIAGWVSHCEMDVKEERVIVVLRPA